MSDPQENPPTFTGTVTELEVASASQTAARLSFVLTPLKGRGEPQSFVVPAETEPRAFTAMATMLTEAYASRLIVTVGYAPSDPGKATAIKLSTASDPKPGRMGFV